MKLSRLDECGHQTFASFGRCVYKYTDCGPWIVAVLRNGKEVGYTDPAADTLGMNTDVRAIKVGSIVEGSDAEIGPYEVTEAEDFWPTVERVNREASDAWDEADKNGELGSW